MSRIAPFVPANTNTKVAATLSQIKASLGNGFCRDKNGRANKG
jgi:hypothetical protein